MRISFIAVLLAIVFFIVACVKEPVTAPIAKPDKILSGALILCEGLWGYNNSTIARYDLNSGQIIQDYFAAANPGRKLGDIANHIVLKGDTAFIALTTAGTIDIIRASSGVSIGTIFLPANSQPRHIKIINDTTAFVTDLHFDCLHEFNPTTFQLKSQTIKVGPAPEGIEASGNYLFVANSGYGDLRATEPKAGTVSVVDLSTRTEITTLPNVPDVIEVLAVSASNKLYAVYNNLPSLTDSTGGIAEFDISSLRETKRLRQNARSLTPTSSANTLYFLNDTGLASIDVSTNVIIEKQLIVNPAPKEYWHALAIDNNNNSVYIANAKDYSINGTLMIFNYSGSTYQLNNTYPIGINPNTILFY